MQVLNVARLKSCILRLLHIDVPPIMQLSSSRLLSVVKTGANAQNLEAITNELTETLAFIHIELRLYTYLVSLKITMLHDNIEVSNASRDRARRKSGIRR
jgi:hypothetical protein